MSTKGFAAGISYQPLAVLSLAVLLFLSRGFLHVLVVPMWEGFDEPFHYAYLQYIAEHGRLPPLNAPAVSQEILESLQLFPTTPHLSHLTPMRFKNFWELGAAERVRLRQSLDSIEPPSKYQLTHLANYQTQHPPLYYLLFVPVYLGARDLSLVDRVFLLRSFSLLLAAVSLPLGYVLARRILGNNWAVLVPVLMSLFPNYYVFIGRVTNDALAVVIFPLIIMATAKLRLKSSTPADLFSAGCLLALGLLTKVYFLTAVPVPVSIVFLKRFQGKLTSKKCAVELLLVLLPSALVAGWWYTRNYIQVGAFSGLGGNRMISSLPLIAWIKALPHLRLGQLGQLVFKLHLWAGNWSIRMVTKEVYQLFGVVYVLCGIGIIRSLLRNHLFLHIEPNQEQESRHYFIISSGFLLLFLAGLIHFGWSNTVAGIFIDPELLNTGFGWYLNVLLPVEAILIFLGIQGLVGIRGGRIGSLIVLGLFIVLDHVALWSREIPYYAGLSIRVAHPILNPVGTAQHVVGALALAFHRVAFLGPHWSSDRLLLGLLITNLCIAAVIFVLVYRCLSGSPAREA